MIIPYDASKEERDKVTAERERKLYQSFENMRKQIDEQIQTMNFSTVSERVKRQQLEEIRNKLQEQLQSHYNALESGLKDDMVSVGQSVLKESESFYTSLNMPIGMSITSFPVEIMNNVVNGSVYDEKWYLSKALWGDYTEKLDQINEVISNGIGLNLSSFEIAKQLEQYVDPAAMHPSKTIVTPCLQDPVSGKLYSKDYVNRHPEKDWSGFKEKNSYFRYGKVDYNAQRLARTLINHAYQQNVVHQAKTNPFATGVKWEASGGERMCEICEERDGKIFPVDDVPLDHPNGMCTFSVVTNLSLMEMSDVLANFVNGEQTDYDDKLYDWYNDRAVKPEQKPAKKEEKKEQHKVDKNDKEFKKYFSKLKTKTGEGGFGHITDIIVSEYGEITTATKLEFYNKYIIGGAKIPSISEAKFNRFKSELSEVKFNKCKDLAKGEISSKSISIISGGDNTSGSCASLALAYIGRRNGIDVIDYRGGDSREYFSTNFNQGILTSIGATQERFVFEKEQHSFNFLQKANIKPGKEYIVSSARHAAVIRKDDRGHFQYLELQSPVSERNGWNSLDDRIMQWRFGEGTTSKNVLNIYDVENLDHDKFKDILGYINTSEGEQQKGGEGSIK